jgi:hypothetical protein
VTNSEIAVKIAQDAIAQINASKFLATTGSYCKLDDSWTLSGTASAQEALKTKNCEVCALGALFASYVINFNQVSVEEMHSGFDRMWERFEDKLTPYFNINDLLLAEFVFERGQTGKLADQLGWSWDDEFDNEIPDLDVDTNSHTSKELTAAYAWGQDIEDDTDRLQDILKNLVENNGKLVIPNKYYA